MTGVLSSSMQSVVKHSQEGLQASRTHNTAHGSSTPVRLLETALLQCHPAANQISSHPARASCRKRT